MRNVITMVDRTNTARICDLEYGTFITGAPNNPESFYTKVRKTKTGEGVHLTWPGSHCVLYNLKTGSLRAIPADSRVVVLCAAMELNVVGPEDIKDFKKF